MTISAAELSDIDAALSALGEASPDVVALARRYAAMDLSSLERVDTALDALRGERASAEARAEGLSQQRPPDAGRPGPGLEAEADPPETAATATAESETIGASSEAAAESGAPGEMAEAEADAADGLVESVPGPSNEVESGAEDEASANAALADAQGDPGAVKSAEESVSPELHENLQADSPVFAPAADEVLATTPRVDVQDLAGVNAGSNGAAPEDTLTDDDPGEPPAAASAELPEVADVSEPPSTADGSAGSGLGELVDVTASPDAQDDAAQFGSTAVTPYPSPPADEQAQAELAGSAPAMDDAAAVEEHELLEEFALEMDEFDADDEETTDPGGSLPLAASAFPTSSERALADPDAEFDALLSEASDPAGVAGRAVAAGLPPAPSQELVLPPPSPDSEELALDELVGEPTQVTERSSFEELDLDEVAEVTDDELEAEIEELDVTDFADELEVDLSAPPEPRRGPPTPPPASAQKRPSFLGKLFSRRDDD